MPKPTKPQQPVTEPDRNESVGSALVPVEADGGELAAWSQTGMPCVTSLQIQSDAGMNMAISAMGSAMFRGKDCVKREVRVSDWLVHKVTPIVGDDGQEGSSMRLVLITDTGETIATRAPAVLGRWRMIVQAARLLKWRWPIIITFKLNPVGKGTEYLTIDSQRPS